jgi:hypothetical protein
VDPPAVVAAISDCRGTRSAPPPSRCAATTPHPAAAPHRR